MVSGLGKRWLYSRNESNYQLGSHSPAQEKYKKRQGRAHSDVMWTCMGHPFPLYSVPNLTLPYGYV